jgi:hypothetical protein
MFLGGTKHIVKNRLISTLDKVFYFKGTLFRGLQNLSSLHQIGWRSAEKISPFFKTCFFLEQLLGFLWPLLAVL